jgi:hypothetical protein
MATHKRGLWAALGTVWATGCVGSHVNACEDRARKLRDDLVRFERDCEIHGRGRWADHHEFVVDYWSSVRFFKEAEARLEVVRQEERANTLRPWSPFHRLASLCHFNE